MNKYNEAMSKAHIAIANVLTSKHFARHISDKQPDANTDHFVFIPMKAIREYFEKYSRTDKMVQKAARAYKDAMNTHKTMRNDLRWPAWNFFDFSDRLVRNLRAATVVSKKDDICITKFANHTRMYSTLNNKKRKVVCYKHYLRIAA